MLATTFLGVLLAVKTFAVNFDWERDQLTESEALSNDAFKFGTDSAPSEDCRLVPGDADWPSDEDWSNFNATLGGALLKPKPLASVCYAGDGYDAKRCDMLQQSWAGMNLQYFHRSCILYRGS